MKHQSHGDHWEAIFTSRKDVVKCLRETSKNGEFLFGRETSYNNEGTDISGAKIFAIEKTDGPIAARALVYHDDEKETNTLVSAFPVGRPLECCPPVSLRHYCLSQWKNRLEANMDGTSTSEEDWHVNFFCADYLSQKYAIRLCDKADYNLVAFALNCEFPNPDQMEIRFEGQKAINFLEKMKREPKYLDNGEVEPVVISTRNMVTYLPFHEDDPDIAEFRSPVSNVEAFSSFGVPMYRMMITIFRHDGDVNVTLYARQSFFDHMPEEGEPIQGVLWMQGEMQTDLIEILKENNDGGEIALETAKFLQAIRRINLEGYDDLNLLIEPFSELKMKPGYVLDGFWADRGETSYTKLYFSAEGSEWRYLPESNDGKFTPDFDDRMYIHNHLDEKVNEILPPLTDYIEGPFTESGIWATYLLMTAEYYLPMTNEIGDMYRVPITRKLDYLRLDNEHLSEYSKDERVKSGVTIVNENTAMVSCAFWSRKDGLCIEKTIVTRTDNGYKFGTSRILPVA